VNEVEVRLRDGSSIVVRPIRPDDKGALEQGFARLSEQSRYQRFLSAISELSASELRYLTEVDHHDHEALIAFESESGKPGEPVGVGRFVRLEDGVSAEAAVTIVDDWHGRGAGTAICSLLADRARAEGIERFTARLLAANETMFEVLGSLGPTRVTARDSGAVEVEIELPERGIGEQMAGVLRVTAAGPVELATPPWGLREAES
jgi:RimJ/RimL family protein N-acetyltransferase